MALEEENELTLAHMQSRQDETIRELRQEKKELEQYAKKTEIKV